MLKHFSTKEHQNLSLHIVFHPRGTCDIGTRGVACERSNLDQYGSMKTVFPNFSA